MSELCKIVVNNRLYSYRVTTQIVTVHTSGVHSLHCIKYNVDWYVNSIFVTIFLKVYSKILWQYNISLCNKLPSFTVVYKPRVIFEYI